MLSQREFKWFKVMIIKDVSMRIGASFFLSEIKFVFMSLYCHDSTFSKDNKRQLFLISFFILL